MNTLGKRLWRAMARRHAVANRCNASPGAEFARFWQVGWTEIEGNVIQLRTPTMNWGPPRGLALYSIRKAEDGQSRFRRVLVRNNIIAPVDPAAVGDPRLGGIWLFDTGEMVVCSNVIQSHPASQIELRKWRKFKFLNNSTPSGQVVNPTDIAVSPPRKMYGLERTIEDALSLGL